MTPAAICVLLGAGVMPLPLPLLALLDWLTLLLAVVLLPPPLVLLELPLVLAAVVLAPLVLVLVLLLALASDLWPASVPTDELDELQAATIDAQHGERKHEEDTSTHG